MLAASLNQSYSTFDMCKVYTYTKLQDSVHIILVLHLQTWTAHIFLFLGPDMPDANRCYILHGLMLSDLTCFEVDQQYSSM